MPDHIQDTSSLDNAPAFMLARVARLLRFDLWKLLEESGSDLTPEQYFMLYRLHEADGRSQIELADRVLVDRPNVTRLVDALEKKKLVRRTADDQDRRKTLVHLTPDGRRLIRRLLKAVVSARKSIFAGITAREIDLLKSVLMRVETNVQKRLE